MVDDSHGTPFTPNKPEQKQKAINDLNQKQVWLVQNHWEKVRPTDGSEPEQEAISVLLALASSAIKLQVPLLPEIANYMADALLNIISGEDANIALGVSKPCGGQTSIVKSGLRDLLGLQVEQTLEENNGMTKTKARQVVANENHLSKKTIERYHLAYLKQKTPIP